MANPKPKFCVSGVIAVSMIIMSASYVSAQSGCPRTSIGYKARVSNVDAYLQLHKQLRALPESEKKWIHDAGRMIHGRKYCNIERLMLENRLKRMEMLDTYPECESPKERAEVQEEVAEHQKDVVDACR